MPVRTEEQTGFRVRGWRMGAGWVDVPCPRQGAGGGEGFRDIDAAVPAALEACGTFRRIAVLGRAGAVVATVEGRRATLPRCGEVRAPALSFFAAALRLRRETERERGVHRREIAR
jgi:hypothetical protein